LNRRDADTYASVTFTHGVLCDDAEMTLAGAGHGGGAGQTRCGGQGGGGACVGHGDGADDSARRDAAISTSLVSSLTLPWHSASLLDSASYLATNGTRCTLQRMIRFVARSESVAAWQAEKV